MAIAKEELQERAQLVRCLEAACGIDHPSEVELAFREALMKKVGTEFGLGGMRAVQFNPPSQRIERPAK